MRGMSPDYLATVFEKPLADAALSVNFARHELERAEAVGPAARLATATETMQAAELKFDDVREAGRAALSTIDDFPVQDTLCAQMRMDRRSAGEIDAFIGHLEAVNAYAGTENAVVAVVSHMSPDAEPQISGPVNFFNPVRPEDGVAVSLSRDDGGHHIRVTADVAYELDISPKAHTIVKPTHGDISLKVDEPAETTGFAATPEEVSRIFEAGETPGQTVVYGDEAVQAVINGLGERREGLRPLLYGGVGYLDRSYEVQPIESAEEQARAEERFLTDLREQIMPVIAGTHDVTDQMVFGDRFALLTPDMQRFIGVSDDAIAAKVHETLNGGWAVASDKGEVRFGGTPASWMWTAVWGNLGRRGFTSLMHRMIEPTQAAYNVAVIQRNALARKLDGTEELTSSTRRRVKRALAGVEDRLEALEQ